MANENTVTIPLDEYFDLRTKAEMNGFLMNEIGQMRQMFCDIERRVFDCENAVKGMSEWQLRKG